MGLPLGHGYWVESELQLNFPFGFGISVKHKYGMLLPASRRVDQRVTIGFTYQLHSARRGTWFGSPEVTRDREALSEIFESKHDGSYDTEKGENGREVCEH